MSFHPLVIVSHSITGDFMKRILDFPVSQALLLALILVKARTKHDHPEINYIGK
jgi:hypothetical protein